MPAPTVSPPVSPFRAILEGIAEIVAADTGLQSYFGWDPVPTPPLLDFPLRRRIFLDDNTTVSPLVSPKLVMTEASRMLSFEILGDGGDTPSELEGMIAVAVYVHVDDAPDPNAAADRGEAEKLLAGDLMDAVITVIRSNVVSPNGSLWRDLHTDTPIVFEQAKGFRRVGMYVMFGLESKVTTRADGSPP